MQLLNSLSSFEKALVQVLFACHCIEDNDLKSIITKLKIDFPGKGDKPIDNYLSNINKHLKKIGLEVKSVFLKSESSSGSKRGKTQPESESDTEVESESAKGLGLGLGLEDDENMNNQAKSKNINQIQTPSNMIKYHTIANTENDEVAQLCGAIISEKEVAAFNSILDILLRDTYENTDGICTVVKGWTKSSMDSFLEHLKNEGWLLTDARSYWFLGPRTYVELRSTLESKLIENDLGSDASDENEDETARITGARQRVLEKLPQVIMY